MESQANFNVIYLGGPTAILEISGLRFIIDPTFDPSNTVYEIGKGVSYTKIAAPVLTDVGHIDAILLSHDQHQDNFDGGGRELAGKVNRLFTTAIGAERLQGNALGLKPWESYEMDAPNGDRVIITGTLARHGPAGSEKLTGDVTGFIITVKGQKNYEIYLTGDTVYYKGIAEVARRFNPAYVFIFAGAAQPRGPFNVTMGANDALDTAHEFPNAIIIPLHYEGWSHYTEGGDVLSRAFNILGIGDRLKLLTAGKPEQLPV